MAVVVKCFVEIFVSKKSLIAFDFGFAGIIFNYDNCSKNKINIYLKEEYAKNFTKFWYQEAILAADSVDSVEVCPQFFNEIKKILLKMPLEQKTYNILCGLLFKSFPRHFRIYDR